MRKLLRRCPQCRKYTLLEKCASCNTTTESPHPPSFSPDDKYAIYRIPEQYAKRKEG